MTDVNDITAQADTAADSHRLTTENIETIKQQQQTPQPSSAPPLQTEQLDNERVKMDESSPFILDTDRSAWNLYGALDLGSEFIENKGSVARDHMANERTFLSWMRTSLALSSAGVGVTQLFKIATSASDDERSVFLRDIGKPLGATFVSVAILCITMGLYRFFHTQTHLKNDEYPAARFSVGILVFCLMSISIVTLIAVLHAARK